ncbi:hypothetical protein IJ118_00690 [Candidatus Saccharibacteria bacterium]|nr:hypothetical protein [Candidatus Saccharibacteria bacterium]
MAEQKPEKSKQKHQKVFVVKDDVAFYERPIITIKEVRKFFTKEELEHLTDEDLMRIIGQMKQIAEALLNDNLVPQNSKSMV